VGAIDLDAIIAFEAGQLEDTEAFELFQRLLNDGSVWTLQGSYGRLAASLLSSRHLTWTPEARAAFQRQYPLLYIPDELFPADTEEVMSADAYSVTY
jgi:hypothetical protein